jgi:hypothetical protein
MEIGQEEKLKRQRKKTNTREKQHTGRLPEAVSYNSELHTNGSFDSFMARIQDVQSAVLPSHGHVGPHGRLDQTSERKDMKNKTTGRSWAHKQKKKKTKSDTMNRSRPSEYEWAAGAPWLGTWRARGVVAAGRPRRNDVSLIASPNLRLKSINK